MIKAVAALFFLGAKALETEADMDVMVIKEGTIVTPYSMYQADVKVVDGVFTAIAKDFESAGTVIDA